MATYYGTAATTEAIAKALNERALAEYGTLGRHRMVCGLGESTTALAFFDGGEPQEAWEADCAQCLYRIGWSAYRRIFHNQGGN